MRNIHRPDVFLAGCMNKRMGPGSSSLWQLNPNRLGEGAVGGDVPDFEADPVTAAEFGRHLQSALAKRFGIRKVDALAMYIWAVAGDDVGKGEREGPLEIGDELGAALTRERVFEDVAAQFSADGEAGDEDFARGDEELAARKHVQHRLPAFVVLGDAIELDVVHVHVSVQLV